MGQNFAIYPKKIEEDPKWQKQRRKSKLPIRPQKRSRPQLRPRLTRWLPAPRRLSNWPLCDAEALVEKQLSRYAAAPGQLTQDQAAALLQSITVYPPQDGTRRIELRWSF